MKRRIIQPWAFGSVTPYMWVASDDSQAGGLVPHYDYLTTYRELSHRLWEPGREGYSQAGYDAPGTGQVAVQLPARTTIHGVKGHVDLCMGNRPQDVGQFWTDEGVPIEVTTKPEPGNTMHPNFAMLNLYGDFGAGDGVVNEVTINWDFTKSEWENHSHMLVLQAKQLRIPMFFAMYRGTYKQLDDGAGSEIDSGPADDPDTLLSVDITNPSVLESSRLDWWDMEFYALPRPDMAFNAIRTGSDPPGYTYYQEPTHSNKGASGFYRYPLNLDANKVLGPDQVLWLHMKTGIIRMMALYTNDAGATVFAPVLYQGHQFSCTMHASALTTHRVAI